MSAVASPPSVVLPESAGEKGFANAYWGELQKLFAQLTTRLMALIAVVGPFAFAAVLKVQSGTPSDALFGAWVHSSGFAISLVILGFAGSWGFPIIAGVLAGDLFATEDRHGTWKTILTRSCSREDVFAGKLLAAGTVVIGVCLLLAVSSLVAGVTLVGAQSLVNLSGVLDSAGRVLGLTIVGWLYCLLPVLAYTSLAILFSVATRNGILGVLGPLMVALVTQLLDLIGRGVIVHTLLIGSAFDGWHGLFVARPFFGPLIVSALVCIVWIAASLTISWQILRRRDFLARADAARPSWTAPIRVVAVTAGVIAVPGAVDLYLSGRLLLFRW
jgi:ABC-2 type transport system permease protein